MACIFSDGGPDVRWCGNESGYVGDPNWAIMDTEGASPGNAGNNSLQNGNPNGNRWVPAEVDVSIRPGWFYHASEDDKVRSVENLMKIYYESIGRGANLILNIPPNKEGLIHPVDSARFAEFGKALKREFSNPLQGKDVKELSATNERGGSRKFGVRRVMDGKKDTYWATDDSIQQASMTMVLKQVEHLYAIRLKEPIQLGQRIESFAVEALSTSGEWQTIAEGTTIGPRRTLRLPSMDASALRLTVRSSRACPLLSEVQLFLPPTE